MAERPILAVDVDGVISLFGFEEPPDRSLARFELIDGMVHCISLGAGERLRRLAEHYELIWATGWEERANDVLPRILGLPELPVINFGGAAQFGTAHWKLEPLAETAEGRALAWIDDSFDESCYEWARRVPSRRCWCRPSRGWAWRRPTPRRSPPGPGAWSASRARVADGRARL